MQCHYDEYAMTYRAVADALVRKDEETVRLACATAWRIAPRSSRTAACAVADALNRIPMRAREHVCRLRLEPACCGGECQRAG